MIHFEEPVTVNGKQTTQTSCKICACRSQQIQATKLEFAKIPTEFNDLSVDSFNTTLYTKDEDRQLATRNKKIVAKYIWDFEEMNKIGKGLFLFSETRGSGKTRLAVSCANALIKRYGKGVRFTTTVNMLDQLRATYQDDNEYTSNQLIMELCDIDILILDDIGVEKATPWAMEKFYQILDTRMTHHKVTFITSNLSMDQLQLDQRILSRLSRMVIAMKMPEEDIRKQIGEEENNAIINKLLG